MYWPKKEKKRKEGIALGESLFIVWIKYQILDFIYHFWLSFRFVLFCVHTKHFRLWAFHLLIFLICNVQCNICNDLCLVLIPWLFQTAIYRVYLCFSTLLSPFVRLQMDICWCGLCWLLNFLWCLELYPTSLKLNYVTYNDFLYENFLDALQVLYKHKIVVFGGFYDTLREVRLLLHLYKTILRVPLFHCLSDLLTSSGCLNDACSSLNQYTGLHISIYFGLIGVAYVYFLHFCKFS